MNALAKNSEIEFAKDGEPGSVQVSVAYTMPITGQRFPVIYKTHASGAITRVEFTEDQGRWLADVLARMFRV